jgi:hypothetical protein
MIAPLAKSDSRIRRPGLFWKEFSEGKSVLLWTACLLIAFFVGSFMLQAITLVDGERLLVSADTEIMVLFGVWVISAALSSSSMISPEIGGTNLQFLSSLPLSRKRIWWTKLLCMLAIHSAALAVSGLLFLALFTLTDRLDFITWDIQLNSVPQLCLNAALLTLPVFVVGGLMTVLVDRTISAFFLTLVVSIALAAFLLGLDSTLSVVHEWLIFPLAGIISLICLSASYELFVHGETLRTGKRLIILRDIFLTGVLPILIALIIAYCWLML